MIASELPRLNVVDQGTVWDPERSQLPRGECHRLTVRVEGFVATGALDTVGDATRSLAADVRKCLMSGQSWTGATNWGNGKVENVSIPKVERAVARASKITGGVALTVEIDYLTSNLDPYTAG